MAAGGSIGERIAAATTRRRIARRLADLDLTPNQTLRDEIEEWAAEHGDRPTLLSDDRAERLSPTGLAGRAHRWARWTILHGIGRGERVALILANRPERLAAWIGVAETGAVAALLDAALPGAHAAPRQNGGRVQADRVKGFGGLHAANSSGRGDGRRDALKTRAASFTRGAL